MNRAGAAKNPCFQILSEYLSVWYLFVKQYLFSLKFLSPLHEIRLFRQNISALSHIEKESMFTLHRGEKFCLLAFRPNDTECSSGSSESRSR